MNDYELDREILELLEDLEKDANSAEKAKKVAEIYENAYSDLVDESENESEILQCEKSMLNAIKWYKKAYEYGDSISAIDIAESYLTLAETGSVEYADEAIKWCETAKQHPDLSNHMSEIESILADSQKLKQELIAFMNKSKNQENIQENKQETKKGGCLKKILYFVIVIVLLSAVINACSDNNTDSTNSEQKESTTSTATENQLDGSEQAGDLFCLIWQKQYATNNGIELNDFSKEHNTVIKNMENMDDNLVYVTIDNILGENRYKMTSETSEYMYSGDTKDNYPDGFGMLLKLSDFDYGTFEFNGYYFNIVYIGWFEKGRYEGYGLDFYEPEGNDYVAFANTCPTENLNEDYTSYYIGWTNYVEYEGMFEKGSRNGLGNSYYADLELRRNLSNIVGEVSLDNVLYDEICVGSFNNGELDGKCKTYTVGTLLYDGEMKNGRKNGFGCLYNDNGQLEYEGEFKNDMKDGKGILYDTNGNVIYDGEWEMDDYK